MVLERKHILIARDQNGNIACRIEVGDDKLENLNLIESELRINGYRVNIRQNWKVIDWSM